MFLSFGDFLYLRTRNVRRYIYNTWSRTGSMGCGQTY